MTRTLRGTACVLQAAALASLLALSASGPSHAQPAPPPDLSVPTTKVLAIGSFTAKATPSVVAPILRSEVSETVRLHLTGKLEQWYVKPDQSGVVFILNVGSTQEAAALLGQLPMGPAGIMTFDLIPLGPISPLRVLLTDSPK